MNEQLKNLVWLACGFVLGAVLSFGYEAVRYVPTAVAFGLLCFGCGALLYLFLDMQRKTDQSIKNLNEAYGRWLQKSSEVAEKESELKAEKKIFSTEKQEWEAEKEIWLALHSDHLNPLK